jgi:hypothetical protein
MKITKPLYFIQPKDGPDPFKPWLHEFYAGPFWCSECHSTRTESIQESIDVFIDSKPSSAALGVVYPPWINIARVDFLELFEPHLETYMKIGKVLSSDGVILNKYVTYFGNRRLIVRGSKKSDYLGVCPNCHRHRYLASYPFYTLQAGYFEQPIYVPWPKRGLVVNKELFSRIDRKKWKGISIFELPILDEPRDGIDALPKDLVIGEKPS